MLGILFWLLFALMTGLGFSAGTTFDVNWRRLGVRLFFWALIIYLGCVIIVLPNLIPPGVLYTVAPATPISFFVTGATSVVVRRRAGPIVARLASWNQLLLPAGFFLALFLIVLPLDVVQFRNWQQHPVTAFNYVPIVVGAVTLLSAAAMFLVLGLAKNAIYEWGVIQMGGRHMWCDFASFYWKPVPKDETVIELVLVRKVWLNLLPNLRCKVKVQDQAKVDALVMKYLPHMASKAAVIEAVSSAGQ